jgi:hypothetical protein
MGATTIASTVNNLTIQMAARFCMGFFGYACYVTTQWVILQVSTEK